MSKLPEGWVKKQLGGLENGPTISTFMGVPLDELSHDELIAVAIAGWTAYQRETDARLARSRSLIEEMKTHAARSLR